MTSGSIGWRVVVRLVQVPIASIAFVVTAAVIVLALEPYSDTMRPAALTIRRTITLAVSLPGRDPRCSIAAGWAATSDEFSRTMRQILHANRVLGNDGQLTQVVTSAGTFWVPRRDTFALAEEIADQQFDLYGHEIRSSDVVLDCGANVGVFTRRALTLGAEKVIAIELAPEPLLCLRRNFEREIREGRVIVYPKGVWDKDATLRLTTNPGLASSANSVALDRGQLGPEVPLTTIDQIVAELKLSRVNFIKMDIEGSEAHALRGATRTLAEHKPRLAISMEHKPSDPDDIPLLVERLNETYSTQCRACGYKTGRLQPEVLLAW